ncbi:putative sulfatase [Devosia pacifica]|uniref:Sulfatase n=1 Tax=Devosia pacifica TaxID=1335967 RepID=A0A918S431_9HYPH|nr:sulfatase [Devosia pacifica]GHA21940.1 putative sulfatase [Devosia pacifica]
MAPNIIYIHTHDTGRFVSPYGYAVPTPHIAGLARQGVLFRRAFSAAPTCSPSRAALLTGNWPHENGMIGLVHRGARLSDPSQHLANVLNAAGYESALVGFQHVAPEDELSELGYGEVVFPGSFHGYDVGPAAADWLRSRRSEKPFFLSVGFSETHRVYPEATEADDPRYIAVPAGYPDTPEIREDTARLHASLRIADNAVGDVLQALDETGLSADTLVIFTTDHGLPWPNAKCTVGDAGTGVALIMRGPAGFSGGKVVDAMVSQIDIFPTLTELAEIAAPEWLRGTSLRPLVAGESESIRDELFAEVTCHAAAEPMRSIRRGAWLFMRRFDGAEFRILPNVDDGDAKTLMRSHGWHKQAPDREALYNSVLDPHEQVNLVNDPDYSDIVADLRDRLEKWMEETNDPLLDPHWKPPANFRLEDRSSGQS